MTVSRLDCGCDLRVESPLFILFLGFGTQSRGLGCGSPDRRGQASVLGVHPGALRCGQDSSGGTSRDVRSLVRL